MVPRAQRLAGEAVVQRNLREVGMPPHARKATTDQLRTDIDAGITGDKVPFPDPAAAPLGTDDEAAGRPPDPRTVERVRRSERAKAERTGAAHERRSTTRWLPWALAAVIIAALAWLLAL
jgi:hypothetical protein